ncbi:MAG: hypothetical protein Q4A64_08715 [Porphyromonadaceae bacterium]|nr:hypothetical protein [Porphyromonadaceae bacterium]
MIDDLEPEGLSVTQIRQMTEVANDLAAKHFGYFSNLLNGLMIAEAGVLGILVSLTPQETLQSLPQSSRWALLLMLIALLLSILLYAFAQHALSSFFEQMSQSCRMEIQEAYRARRSIQPALGFGRKRPWKTFALAGHISALSSAILLVAYFSLRLFS